MRYSAVLNSVGLKPTALRTEYRCNPTGIDEPKPRLSWRLESTARGARQSAYRLLVASTPKLLRADRGDLWDSGRVESSATANRPYSGQGLCSRQQCYWKVCVWDAAGKTEWSKTAQWSMGLLEPNDWHAEYIAFRDSRPVHRDKGKLCLPPARQYRREFLTGQAVKRAVLYGTSFGIHEFYLNGARVGDAWFAPGWTDYRQRAYYWTHDVTKLLQPGTNAFGAWIADGWYAGYVGFGLLTGIGTEAVGRDNYGKTPAFMAQLEIEYADGSRSTVCTDKSWKVTASGPIREADFLMGEFYDARRELSGWTQPGFDDSAWQAAILASENGPVPATFHEWSTPTKPGAKLGIKGRKVNLGFKRPGKLEAFPGEPVRVTQTLTPVAITSPAKGVHIYDLGQNFAGLVRLEVKGPVGTKIRLRYAEMLHPDGRMMTENLRRARATDHYVLQGDPKGETWTPRFTFHGFRYVEVTGYPGRPRKSAITGLVLHSDTSLTSGFECSDPVANQLFQNVVWTQRANFIDIPTDCPQRDERLGWTGDAQIYVRTATYNADVAAFFTKWLRELMESQRPSGAFPDFAPLPFQHFQDYSTGWGDAGVICPWTIWKTYGDTRIIERCWPHLTRFLDWRQARSKQHLGINHGNDWGDWLSFGQPTPIDYIDTIYYARCAKLMAEMAAAIGKTADSARYAALFARVKKAFVRKYMRPDGSLRVDTQTAYALALSMDLVPAGLRRRSGRLLAHKIRSAETHDNSGMTTGFLGTGPLLPVLSSVGEHELAVRHFQSRKFPSWGYEVEQGATTIWERWNSYTKEKGFGGEQNAFMNSFSHYSFGAVGEWMFARLAGIESDSPGYERILIRPEPPRPKTEAKTDGGLRPITWVKAHYDAQPGRIVSEWRIRDGIFELKVTLPANTSAILHLPTDDAAKITESGRKLKTAQSVRLLRVKKGQAVLLVEAGSYRFLSPAFERRKRSSSLPRTATTEPIHRAGTRV